MAILDFEALDRAPLQKDPCDFVVVPHFVGSAALAELNRDFPSIEVAGNFPPEVALWPDLLDTSRRAAEPSNAQKFSAKFAIDLEEHPLQITVRKYSEDRTATSITILR